ncbi:MAG TPA: hypothetical protein VNN73_03060 [Blastocatellia bacterium]|nr:hypothetical protein [Blastocatellia bacterium]
MSADDKQGKLRLDLVDVYGKRIGGRADISLRHLVLSDSPRFNGLDASKRIVINNLHGAPQGLYQITIDPSAYLQVSQFVTIKASGFTDQEIKFPVDPSKVKSVVFPKYADLSADLQKILENSDNVLSFEGLKGEALYNAETLDDFRKACILNIAAKCAATRLSNGKTVLPYIEKINELRGDRFFAVVPKELREETKNSVAEGVFFPAPEILHTPPAGFDHAGSYKTFDKYGNLQLTFFAKGNDWLADIDIDDASGLEHPFQVIEHRFTGKQTHPFAIHEILVARQGIDPGYRFEV